MRDYQKDLEVCEKATEEPWTAEQMTSKKARRGGGYIYYKVVQAVNAICHYLTKKDADFIALARTALPFYIKRCMALESKLQQAEEREAALREALEEVAGSSICKASRSIARQILSSPSLSRYREALAVVDATKNLIFALVVVGSDEVTDFHINKTKDALTAYDKAGEGAGK